jgi:hypothetical protein
MEFKSQALIIEDGKILEADTGNKHLQVSSLVTRKDPFVGRIVQAARSCSQSYLQGSIRGIHGLAEK